MVSYDKLLHINSYILLSISRSYILTILITKLVSISRSYILTDNSNSNLKKNQTNCGHGVQDAGRYIAKAPVEK